MVNIDTVYQRVLALANKEQRGYITPQDFNLFANQAQMEIFEQYFYDINLARKTQGNDTVYADVDDMLEEKLQVFEKIDFPSSWGVGSLSASRIIPDYVYRIDVIYYYINGDAHLCEILNWKDYIHARNGAGYLIQPTPQRPIAAREGNQLVVSDTNYSHITDSVQVHFFNKPSKVNWGYIVMNNKAMYNQGGGTVHFELHPSEETQLVNKILKLAGIAIQQPDIMTAGQCMDMATIQQQPKI